MHHVRGRATLDYSNNTVIRPPGLEAFTAVVLRSRAYHTRSKKRGTRTFLYSYWSTEPGMREYTTCARLMTLDVTARTCAKKNNQDMLVVYNELIKSST